MKGERLRTAETWLRSALVAGSMPATQLQRGAAEAGISLATLRLAKESLQVRSMKMGAPGDLMAGWWWVLSAEVVEDVQICSEDDEILLEPSNEPNAGMTYGQKGTLGATAGHNEHVPAGAHPTPAGSSPEVLWEFRELALRTQDRTEGELELLLQDRPGITLDLLAEVPGARLQLDELDQKATVLRTLVEDSAMAASEAAEQLKAAHQREVEAEEERDQAHLSDLQAHREAKYLQIEQALPLLCEIIEEVLKLSSEEQATANRVGHPGAFVVRAKRLLTNRIGWLLNRAGLTDFPLPPPSLRRPLLNPGSEDDQD